MGWTDPTSPRRAELGPTAHSRRAGVFSIPARCRTPMDHLNRGLCAAIALVALVCLVSGCGSSANAPPTTGAAVEAGPNSRIKFKEDYKKMLGKDGQLLWKPSQSRRLPPGITKK